MSSITYQGAIYKFAPQAHVVIKVRSASAADVIECSASFSISIKSKPNKSSAGFLVRYDVVFVITSPLETMQGTFPTIFHFPDSLCATCVVG